MSICTSINGLRRGENLTCGIGDRRLEPEAHQKKHQKSRGKKHSIESTQSLEANKVKKKSKSKIQADRPILREMGKRFTESESGKRR